MGSLLQTAGLLLGEDDISSPRVKVFADKIVSYCDSDEKKANKIIKVLEVLNDEVLPIRKELGEDGFMKVMGVLREKIYEVGGVTGFLPGIEGSGQKKT